MDALHTYLEPIGRGCQAYPHGAHERTGSWLLHEQSIPDQWHTPTTSFSSDLSLAASRMGGHDECRKQSAVVAEIAMLAQATANQFARLPRHPVTHSPCVYNMSLRCLTLRWVLGYANRLRGHSPVMGKCGSARLDVPREPAVCHRSTY